MDRLLKPEKLTADPSRENSMDIYIHWKGTLENYLEIALPTSVEKDGTIIVDPLHEKKKRMALMNCVSSDIFKFFSNTSSYNEGMDKLNSMYLRPENTIYNRHKLMTCAQDTNIDDFMGRLELLSKSCDFKDVTAEDNRKDYVRDAFINGLKSSSIRQRLLENTNLSLPEAFRQARSLESAEKLSSSYTNRENIASLNTRVKKPSTSSSFTSTSTKAKNHKHFDSKVCYFCGKARHSRNICPARNGYCSKCSIKGHWASVCKKQVNAAIQDEDGYSSEDDVTFETAHEERKRLGAILGHSTITGDTPIGDFVQVPAAKSSGSLFYTQCHTKINTNRYTNTNINTNQKDEYSGSIREETDTEDEYETCSEEDFEPPQSFPQNRPKKSNKNTNSKSKIQNKNQTSDLRSNKIGTDLRTINRQSPQNLLNSNHDPPKLA